MKIELFYYLDTSPYKPEHDILISTFERSKKYSPELVFIKKIDIDVPDVDVPDRAFTTKALVTTLEEENKDLLATVNMKIQANKNKINSLLCLENKEPT
jgi:hypothetical protein